MRRHSPARQKRKLRWATRPAAASAAISIYRMAGRSVALLERCGSGVSASGTLISACQYTDARATAGRTGELRPQDVRPSRARIVPTGRGTAKDQYAMLCTRAHSVGGICRLDSTTVGRGRRLGCIYQPHANYPCLYRGP